MTLIKSHSCTKCGGALIVHNDRQQYECPYCSVFYDYEYFRSRDILDQADSSLKILQDDIRIGKLYYNTAPDATGNLVTRYFLHEDDLEYDYNQIHDPVLVGY